MTPISQLMDPRYQRFELLESCSGLGVLWKLELYLRGQSGTMAESDIDLAAMTIRAPEDALRSVIESAIKCAILTRESGQITCPEIVEDVVALTNKIRGLNNQSRNVRRNESSLRSTRQGRVRKGSIKRGSAEGVSFPPALDTPECRAAWADWLEYKRARGESYKTSKSQQVKLRQAASWGAAAMVQAIQEAMGNNWAGFFAPKAAGYSPAPAFAPAGRPQPKPFVAPVERADFRPAKETPEEVRALIATTLPCGKRG